MIARLDRDGSDPAGPGPARYSVYMYMGRYAITVRTALVWPARAAPPAGHAWLARWRAGSSADRMHVHSSWARACPSTPPAIARNCACPQLRSSMCQHGSASRIERHGQAEEALTRRRELVRSPCTAVRTYAQFILCIRPSVGLRAAVLAPPPGSRSRTLRKLRSLNRRDASTTDRL